MPKPFSIRRERYIVMTKDRKYVWCGYGRGQHWQPVNDLDRCPIKTFESHQRAIGSFRLSRDDFDRAEVVCVTDTIKEV